METCALHSTREFKICTELLMNDCFEKHTEVGIVFIEQYEIYDGMACYVFLYLV